MPRLKVVDKEQHASSTGGVLMGSSALPWPNFPFSLSLGRSPDSHAREKSLHGHQFANPVEHGWQHAEWTSLHHTAPHRTARQTAPKIALLHTINSLPCSHRACAFSGRCNCSAAGRFHALRGRWQSEAWRARSVWRFWRSARRKHESLLSSKHAAMRMPSG